MKVTIDSGNGFAEFVPDSTHRCTNSKYCSWYPQPWLYHRIRGRCMPRFLPRFLLLCFLLLLLLGIPFRKQAPPSPFWQKLWSVSALKIRLRKLFSEFLPAQQESLFFRIIPALAGPIVIARAVTGAGLGLRVQFSLNFYLHWQDPSSWHVPWPEHSFEAPP
jgi:hypothetical protein